MITAYATLYESTVLCYACWKYRHGYCRSNMHNKHDNRNNIFVQDCVAQLKPSKTY